MMMRSSSAIGRKIRPPRETPAWGSNGQKGFLMAGKKGRSGGARTPRDPATAKKRGPLIRRVALEKDAAHEIKVLLLAAGREYTAENVAAQIAIWSRQAWEDYEAGIAPDLAAEIDELRARLDARP